MSPEVSPAMPQAPSAGIPPEAAVGTRQEARQGTGPTTPRRRLVVIGGGITGLAAARAARQRGLEVTVLEAGRQLGGKLALGSVAGVQVDLGAESILARRTEGTDLAQALGLSADIVHPATSSASIWTRGELRPLPGGQLMGVPGDMGALAASGILSEAGLARARADRDLPDAPIEGDIAVGEFVARRLGREVTDRLVEPLLGGVYAGRADRLSLKATVPQLAGLAGAGTPLSEGVRSLLAAAAAARPPAQAGDRPAPVFAGLRGGVGRLAVELAADLTRGGEPGGVEIRLGAQAEALVRDGRGWRVELADGSALAADAVLLAVPAFAAARLLAGPAAAAAAELAGIEYASVAIVTLAVPRAALGNGKVGGGASGGARLDSGEPGAGASNGASSDVAAGDDGPTGGNLDAGLPGSGFLVPPVDGRAVKAATFSSSKWAWLARSAGDLVVLRASLGRAGRPAELDRDDADLVKLVLADLADAVGLRARPAGTHVQRWGDSLPQYAVGHLDRVARVRAGLPEGLAVAGAAYDGIGIPACVASAQAAISTLMNLWNERPTTDD